MKKIFLYFNTIKYLKWRQLYFKLVRKVIKPRVTEKFRDTLVNRSKKWHHELLFADRIDRNLNVTFLNKCRSLKLPNDWNNEEPSKLWVYKLHYFED